jgi:hypothetical protein
VVIAREEDRPSAETLLAGIQFRYKVGASYLGSYLGADSLRDAWLEEKLDAWVAAVCDLGKIARRYPQTAYAGVTRSLQMKRQYSLPVLLGIAAKFHWVERALEEHFLPALFDEPSEIPPKLCARMSLPARWSGLGLQDPAAIADKCHEVSKSLTEPLSASLIAWAHLDAPTYSRRAHAMAQVARTQRDAAAEDEYTGLLADAPTGHQQALERRKDSGAWLTA